MAPCFIGFAYSSRARSAHSSSVSKISSLLAPPLTHRVQLIKLILLKRPVQELFVRIQLLHVIGKSWPDPHQVQAIAPRAIEVSYLHDHLSVRIVASCACASAMRRTRAAAMLASALGLALVTLGPVGQTTSTKLGESIGRCSSTLSMSALVTRPVASTMGEDIVTAGSIPSSPSWNSPLLTGRLKSLRETE